MDCWTERFDDETGDGNDDLPCSQENAMFVGW